MKAYWIRTEDKRIVAVEFDGLGALQRMVGGYIELAKAWPSGDVLYVNEEGLLHGPFAWFHIRGRDQALAGNGVVVGREIDDAGRTADPVITLTGLMAEVQFID